MHFFLSWLLLGTLSLMSMLSVKRPLQYKSVLLSTSKAARRRMTAWRNEHEGCFWAVKLDVRDLGGHLDVTMRAVADTLSGRVRIVTTQTRAVGALTLGFQRMLGMVRSKYLPGGLHGCEGAAVSVTALSAFRSAIARAVWSKKLPMTDTPALLLGVLIQLSSSFGIVFVNLDVILRIVLMMELALFVYWTMLLMVPQGMDLFISSFSLLMKLFSFLGL